MYVIQCDICKKVIASDLEEILAGKVWDRHSFCFTCARPIINFLKKNKLWSEPEK